MFSLQRSLRHENETVSGLSRVLWRRPAHISRDWACRSHSHDNPLPCKATAVGWYLPQSSNPVPRGQCNGIFFSALNCICKPLMFTCFVAKLMSVHPLKNLIKVRLWQVASPSLDSTLGADDLIGASSHSLLLPHLFVSTSCITKINSWGRSRFFDFFFFPGFAWCNAVWCTASLQYEFASAHCCYTISSIWTGTRAGGCSAAYA